MKDLRIVIPAYNEEDCIAYIIDRVQAACPDSEILVVDDGSKDKTADITRLKGVTVISNKKNMGHGATLKKGFHYKSDSYDNIKYFAFLDADGTYPPEVIPELYKLCKENGFQVAIGSRFLGKKNAQSLIRKIGNRLFALMFSLYSGKRITDASTGLRVFDRRLLPLLETTPDGLDFVIGMTALIMFEDLRIAEIPIEHHERIGRSKISIIKDGYRFIRVIMNSTRVYRPALFYTTLGIPFLAVNFLVKSFSFRNA